MKLSLAQQALECDEANFILKDCRRVLLTNLSVDCDWEQDPLGEFVTVVDTHLGARDTFESYLDLQFADYRRHPLHGRSMPVQTLYTADESRDRLGYVKNCGSLFCQIYSGLTSCANMAMTWSLTPALWRFKCGANADPRMRRTAVSAIRGRS